MHQGTQIKIFSITAQLYACFIQFFSRKGSAIDEFTFTFSKATAAGVDFAFLVNLIRII